MQGINTSHKRKSIEKIDPEMPRRKISENSRQQSKRRHRTQYKGIDSPEVELKDYKRKNFKILNQLQTSAGSNSKNVKDTLITQRTQQSEMKKQQSTIKHIQNNSIQRNKYNNSVNSFQSDTSLLHHQSQIKPRQQITSRFTQNHHDPQESLAFLINHTKSQDSNPLINTARLKQEQVTEKNKIYHRKESQKKDEIKSAHFLEDKIHPQNLSAVLQNKSQNEIRQTFKESDQNQNQDDQNQQNQYNEGENFDDYQFGGTNSETIQDQISLAVTKNGKINKTKKKKIMLPPKIQSYSLNKMIQKPNNWRQLNRYIPQTEQQHRMALQSYLKQKKAIQSIRQQQQLIKMIQQYQLSKNNVTNASKRKTQTNKMIQHIYKQKKLANDKKHSLSLPQLKKISNPKIEILIPTVNQIYPQIDLQKNFNEQKYKVNNILAKGFEVERKKSQRDILIHSLSYSKMGFGSKKSRLLNQQEIKQSQMQNVQKIEKKLREKGISFDSTSIRKGLLNLRDVPLYKISKNITSQIRDDQNLKENPNKIKIPQKQLPSNGFYKIFPL